jgi:hypothetical protein
VFGPVEPEVRVGVQGADARHAAPTLPVVAASVALVAFTLVFHLGILANPGFYSHDEWEKFDQLRQHGFWGAARGYLHLQPGAEFGYPVRPIGFVQQLFSAQWMARRPSCPTCSASCCTRSSRW